LARKSAIGMVASQMIPVNPGEGEKCSKEKCDASQPPYIRSKRTFAKSSELIRYRTCVADKLRGKEFGSREAVRAAFTEAAHECK